MELARLLKERVPGVDPEIIHPGGTPDVLVDIGGLKLLLDGRFSDLDALVRKGGGRVREGSADIAVSVLYPAKLRACRTPSAIRRELGKARLAGGVCLFKRSAIAWDRFERASLEELAGLVSDAFGRMAADETVRELAAELGEVFECAVETACSSGVTFESETVIRRLRKALGVPDKESG